MANGTWLDNVPSANYTRQEIPKIIGHRHANHADIPRICQLTRTETYDLFGDVDVGKVFEKACISLVQINAEQEVVSNVSLCNFPNVPSVPAHDWLSWITTHYGLPGIMERNTLFVHLLVWDTRYSETFFKDLLSRIFTITSYCLHVIMVSPPGLETGMDLFKEDMTKIVPRGKTNDNRVQTLYLSLRHRHRPKLKIRRVVEEDNDDLIPIIDAESKRLRELYGDFYISEIVQSVEEGQRRLIVAESEGLATGVMCLNGTVDVDLLDANFELAPYNALRKTPSVDIPESPSSASSVVNKTASEVLSIDNAKDRERRRFSRAVAQTVRPNSHNNEASDPEDSLEITVDSPKTSEKRIGPSVNFESRLRESIFAEAISELPTRSLASSAYKDEDEDEPGVSRIDENIDRRTSAHGEVNAFALELFSVDRKIDDRYGQDYLEAAFECFPDRDYCVMVIPSTQPFFPFLENFVRVPLRFDKDFPMVLYVAHRSTLLGLLNSRRMLKATAYDREWIESFLHGIPKKKIVLEDFDEAIKLKNSQKECYVFICDNKLIGIAILCPEPCIDELRLIYNVEEYVSMENTARDAHARLLHFILVPIFSVYHRYFFRELMRLSGNTVLYYRLYDSETTAPNRTRPLITCLDAMIPVKSRTRIHHPWPPLDENDNQLDDEKFSLFLMTPRFSMMPKPVVNAKIVVVGASDCGVSFAECLALAGPNSRMGHFTNLTLVSPNGLPFEHKGSMEHATMIPFRGRYCYAYRQVVPSRVWINVVHGTVSNINRKDKYVTVWGLGNLSYDYLVLTCGLQYRSPEFHRGDMEAGKRGIPQSGQEFTPLNCFCINDDVDAATCLERLKELTNEFTSKKSIVLYGHSIDCYSTLNTLISCGLKGTWITLIQPRLGTCEKRSNIFYEDEEVDDAIARAIETSGVKVYAEWALKDWILEDGDNAENDDDRGSVIKILRIESRTKKKFIACDALINFDKKSIPMRTFMAISRAGLVFDGRLVIDPEFRTNDPSVFAAGAFTKYSRKYHADSWQHEYYNNIEVGERLARSLKRRIDSRSLDDEEEYHSGVSANDSRRNTGLPVFRAPKLVYSLLPGNLHYLHVRKPGKNILRAIAIARGTYGDVLVTGSASAASEIGYFRLRLNQYNRIETITCLSKKAFRVQDIITLYGKHDSILNDLKIRFQNSLVSDLYAYFAEPWAAALFHDKFDCLRVENRATLLSKISQHGGSLVDEVIAAFARSEWKALEEKERRYIESRYAGSVYQDAISSTLINFLQAEEELLPVYCNPRKLRRQLMEDDE